METLELKLAVNRMEFLDTAEKVRLEDRLAGLGELEDLDRTSLEQIVGRPVRARLEFRTWADLGRRDALLAAGGGFFVLGWGSEGYPELLSEIPDPPFVLWGRGQRPDWERVWTAVVGTRAPTEQARRAAFTLARDLGALGLGVVSGLAYGIDTAAHRGALESGGPTLAVLGQGIDGVSPRGNRNLARRLLDAGGCLLSEYGPGEGAFPHRFVARNRIISGLCRAVVVVQAPAKSGALITADFALDQGRDLAVHAEGLEGERGAGGRNWVRQGAPVVGSAADVVDLLNGKSGGFSPQGQYELPWEEAE